MTLDTWLLCLAAFVGCTCFTVYGFTVGLAVTGELSPVFGVIGGIVGGVLAWRVLFRYNPRLKGL